MALKKKFTSLQDSFRRSRISIQRLARDLWRQFKDSEIQLVASSLSYSTALSIVPFLVVSLATFQAIGGLDELYPKVQALILMYLKETTGNEVSQFVRTALTKAQLNSLGVAGAAALVFTSLRLLSDMDAAINRVWGHRHRRPLHQRIFVYWILMIIFPTALAAYAGLRSAGSIRPLFRALPQDLIDLGIVFCGLFLIYKFVPLSKVRNRPAVLSSLLAAILVVTTADSFRWVVLRFFNYSKIYGSLAAIPLVLLLILVMWYIVLLGAVVCASTHRDKA